MTFKGHYFGLFQYDTTIGNTTASLQGSFDNLSGFSTRSRLEFSPNSELLYTTNDNVGITQFNITSFNANTIGNTSFTVLNCGFSQECAYDLKLAPNGKIYIVINALNTLAVINQPDATGSACEYESNALAYQGAVGSMFARTVNLNCISVFFQPDVIEVCLGEPTEFSLSGSTNADSVLWDFGDPNASEAENQSTEFNPSHTYSEAGEYTVTVEVTSVLGVETFELTAIVYVVPNPTLDPEYTLCAGESLVLSGGEAESYLWNTGATTSDITVTAGGAYSVTATNAICSGEASTVVVFIEPPAFSLGADQYICDDQPVTLSAPFDVLWSTGETAESITVNATGEYTAEASNECFTTSASLLMVFVEEPDFGLAGRMTACEGDTINVSPSIHGADLVWTTPFGSQNGGSIAITESGDYTLTATLHGCPYTHDIETEFFGFVDVDAVILPNIFSPNNDGINDMYRPIFAANPSLNLCQLPVFTANLRIFNRWGNVVFEDGCAWNGRTESGNEISEGVYFYIVDYASTCLGRGGERQKTGTIDVVR